MISHQTAFRECRDDGLASCISSCGVITVFVFGEFIGLEKFLPWWAEHGEGRHTTIIICRMDRDN